MYLSVSDLLIMLASTVNPEGEVVKRHRQAPKIKPKRRRSPIQNISDNSDYNKLKVREFREEKGVDQKTPDSIKKYRRKKKKEMEMALGI